MERLCPFRKKKVTIDADEIEWEEHFMECVKEKCMAWQNGCCGLAQGITFIPTPTVVEKEQPSQKSEEKKQEQAKYRRMSNGALFAVFVTG
ncbi:hypothetical protein JOC37_001293 [Desulfohalotomaculum tongense]|uniref:hypothetical protein n=1 Tax=Desulforadius tongensis TaxID=1216062 RepID=UPI0019578F8D|nr:hypothetical protein [Desulforadius tongensis]MBM7854913.1 hypothetical protein [Desulforadius tongensis]